jgi:hypothetical protein
VLHNFTAMRRKGGPAGDIAKFASDPACDIHVLSSEVQTLQYNPGIPGCNHVTYYITLVSRVLESNCEGTVQYELSHAY